MSEEVNKVIEELKKIYTKKAEIKRIINNINWLKQQEESGNRKVTNRFEKFKFALESSIECYNETAKENKNIILEQLFKDMKSLIFSELRKEIELYASEIAYNGYSFRGYDEKSNTWYCTDIEFNEDKHFGKVIEIPVDEYLLINWYDFSLKTLINNLNKNSKDLSKELKEYDYVNDKLLNKINKIKFEYYAKDKMIDYGMFYEKEKELGCKLVIELNEEISDEELKVVNEFIDDKWSYEGSEVEYKNITIFVDREDSAKENCKNINKVLK